MDEMFEVEGGEFQMRSKSDKASSSEKPVSKVTVGGFRMGKFEVG